MTLNEELRALLDERAVEWEARDVFEQTTQWSTYNGAFVYWARERDGKLLVETTAPTKCSASCTPKQAVEATLGSEPDDAAMVKLHERMNAALLEYERAQGIEQRDGDGAIVVPFVAEMHQLLEEAATLGDSDATGRRQRVARLNPREADCDTGAYEWMECECGFVAHVFDWADWQFCPSCGARLRRDC